VTRRWYSGLGLILVLGTLAGCAGGQAAPVDEGGEETYTSEYLDASYASALNTSSQLALGTLLLEDTDNAVTAEQAAALLPLWQALRGGVTAEVEVNAVLRQIEATMAPEQLEAVAAMQLTREDLQAWMQEQGLGTRGGFPGPGAGEGGEPDARATQRAESGGEGLPSGGEMPPEMATRRAEFENMSEEERQAAFATAQASGEMPGRPGGAGGAAGRQFPVLLNPLIELLTERAAE
jgi:hypothetical protein